MTEYEVGRDTSQVLKMSDEINTPQRSILDFFKTPQKDLTSKPKDLLGFFCRQENIKKSPEIICNGKDHHGTKENVAKQTGVKSEGKNPKKRKRATSKEQDSDGSEDGKNEKPAPRKNKLKRKKQESSSTKVNQKMKDEEKDCEILGSTRVDIETNSEKISETGNTNGKSINEVGDNSTPNTQNGDVFDQERKKLEGNEGTNQGKTTPPGECGSISGATTEEGEECSGNKDEQGETMNLEWNKRIDIEKCRTPNDKCRERSSKKRNKLRKRKKEADSGETVNRSLNLSDICTNMADVSIISDGGLNTSQVLNGVADAENDKSQGGGSIKDKGVTEISYEAFLGKTADSEAPVWRDRGYSGETEESYKNFVSKQNCDETEALHGEKVGDKDMYEGNSEDLKEEESKTNSLDNKEKPVKKKKGRPRKPSDSSHGVKKEAPKVDNDKVEDDKLDEMESVKEVSYLDYLTAISKSEKGAGTEDGAHSCQSDEQTGEPVRKPCEEDGTDIPMPKQYPSITNFFSRVGKGQKCPNAFKEKQSVSYIKAIIHETPGEKTEKREKSLGKVVEKKTLVRKHHSDRRTSVRKHQSEDTIEVLSSEIIAVDEHIKVKSGENDKKDGKENVDEMSGNSNKSKKGKKSGEPSPDCKTTPTGTEQDAEKEKRKLFLHSVDTEDRSVTQKKSQATLSFSKGGLQMGKAVKESAERASESTPELEKKKRGRPKKNKAETTQERTSMSSLNSSQVFEDSGTEDKGDESLPSLSERRKSLRQKYKVKLLQNQGAQSPIRMKFIRCMKSSSGSSQDESLTPKSKQKAKQQLKAQQLVEKAKRMQGARRNSKVKSTQKMADRSKRSEAGGKMTKGRGKVADDVIEVGSDSDTAESGGRRRSSRLSDRLKSMKEMEVVELDDDDENTNDSCYTPTKPSKKAGGQRPTAAKKPDVKNIAPIFLKKKSSAVNSPVKRVLDPAAEKLKRDFLMSGVPAELKQSVSAATPTVLALYPPFPRDNHIQQRSMSRMWNMENVVLKTVAEVEFCVKLAVNWGLNFRARQPMANNKMIVVPSQSERFKENITSCLLTEIIQDCPSFPAQKMYSMLREKQDDEVIEEAEVKLKEKEAKEKPGKDKPRRSLRRRKEVIEIIDVGGSPESKDGADKKDDKQENVLPALSWPEKYQPLHSSEIIGNTAIVKKLRAWLLEWKQCLDKEAKRAKLMMMKEKKKARKDQVEEEGEEEEWWADDASDFDLDSDSEGEGERLCNTAMLTGPLGVGKTATVYALAQELGFKVFEVNASSSRNGKRILAQLQEATQSQQVSQHHFSGSGTPKKLKNNSNVGPSSKPKPTFFTNLFKKAGAKQQAGTDKAEDKDKLGRKKRKREEDAEHRTEKEMKKRKKEEDGGKAGEKKKSLNLSCTSLILFDEVDLVFEAFDKGFWAAVKNFMDTTKIPIILTSNDTSLPQKFDGRFEHYRFRVPPLIPTACYLRLVALVENIRMDWDEIVNLVAIYKSDIRRVLQILQLWVTSGGGQKVTRSIKESRSAAHQEVITHLPVIDENSCSQDAVTALRRGGRATPHSVQDDDDDDFVSIKPITSRKHQIISDDESSNPATITGDRVGERVLMEAQKCSAVNVGCLESILGLPIQSEGGVLGFLKKTLQEGSERDEDLVVLACQQYLKLKVDLLYDQHLDLLPLKKVTVENLGRVKKDPSPKTKRRRIKIASDLYDSEGSDSESTSVTKTTDRQTSIAQTIDGQTKVEIEEMAKQKEENYPELLASLCELTHFYDNVSFTDTMRSLEERILGDENSESGMTEDPKLYEHSSLWMQEHLNELGFTVQWKSFNRCCGKLREIAQRLSDVEDERFTIPVLKGRNSTLTQGIACPDSRSCNSVTKAYINVQSSLPLSTQRPRSSIMCDYLPYLRSITKNEQMRQAAKLKRRFHHYFDQIGLSLKDQTLEVLNLSLV